MSGYYPPGYEAALHQHWQQSPGLGSKIKGAAKGAVKGLRKGLGLEGGQARIPDHLKGVDVDGNVARSSGKAEDFADTAQQGYGQLGQQGQGALDYFGRTMRGENSVAAEQLRQGLGQQLAAQSAMAAGARPGQSGMAARNAAMGMGRAQSGMAGNAALAGIAERNAAAQQYSGLLQGLRGQDLSATLDSRGQALGGYSDIEKIRMGRAGIYAGLPTAGQQFADLATGVAAMAAKGG